MSKLHKHFCQKQRTFALSRWSARLRGDRLALHSLIWNSHSFT